MHVWIVPFPCMLYIWIRILLQAFLKPPRRDTAKLGRQVFQLLVAMENSLKVPI